MYILFDIDDTLLNFRDTVEGVIATALAEYGIVFGDAEWDTYHRLNTALWDELDRGALSRTELYAIRWPRVLKALGLPPVGAEIEARFRYHLSRTAVPEHGAAETLAALRTRHTLCTASNAPQAQQEQRLALCGLAPYFTHVFTSEGLGADKPHPAFYERVLTALGNPDPSDVWMVGDSPDADIVGAAALGLRTCLYNTRRKPLPADCHPTYTVTSLTELCQFF